MIRLAPLIAALAALQLSSPARAQTCGPFADVAASNPFCANIQWMYNRGITLGCTATAYCPSEFVRRDQMAAFMYRLGFQNAFLHGGNAFGATGVLGTVDDQPLEVRVNDSTVMRYVPGAASPNVIGGHAANAQNADAMGATIGGGGTATSPNRVTDNFGAVAGGWANRAGNDSGAVSDATHATVGGGFFNAAGASGATVGGGAQNEATGSGSTVSGGQDNTAAGQYSTVPGGRENLAAGHYSVAMGRRAIASAAGSILFADSNNLDFTWDVANAFAVRATGGVRFVVDIDGSGNATWRCSIASGSGWSCLSDRNMKQNLLPIDARDVLTRLAAMPVYAWNPKGRNAHVLHYGPMAQDFRAAFGLGDDDTTIGMQDADGVALAAIQGLNEKVDDALASRDREIELLRVQLAELRALLQAHGRTDPEP